MLERKDFYELYDNGIEIILGGENIIPLEKEKWKFALSSEKNNVIRTRKIGRIKFIDIIKIDFNGSKNMSIPHIYCKFSYNGTPYEKIYYQDIEKIYHTYELDDKEPT